jgi:RHS repeat-associated protein
MGSDVLLGFFRSCRKLTLLTAVMQCGLLIAPTAGAAVGRTIGIPSVSDDGAFSYSIPVFTPLGPRGIQPSVALVYSSSLGVGYVGRGWMVSGLSSITRCNKTVAQDGAAASVTLVAADAYCLDGRRLILQAGSYGQNNSEWDTEITDFSRIKASTTNSSTGPDSWVVERKDGTVWTYGTSTGASVPVSGVAHMWFVSEIRDRSGNKVRFLYEAADGTTTGTTHPVKIEWTQTAASSGSYLYSIEFAYSSGGNTEQSSYAGFVAGATVLDSDLLQGISVKNNGTTVRKYALGYETSTSTGLKRLTTVTECSDAAASDCLSPTTIAYQNGQTGFPSTPSSTTSAGSSATIHDGEFDYNGDGFIDVTYRRSGAWYIRFGSASGFGSEISSGTSELTFSAFNPFGTGRTVILARASGTWHAYQWNGSSFSATNTGVSASVGINVRDVNADGRDDLVYLTNYPCSGCGPQPYMGIGVKPSTSTGTTLTFGSVVETQYTPIVGTSSFPPASPPYFSSGILWPDRFSRERGQLDINGDGRGDVTVNAAFWYYVWSDYAQDYVVVWESVDVALAATDNLLFTDFVGNSGGLPYGSSLNSDGCVDIYSTTSVMLSNCLGSGTTFTPSGSIVDTMDWNGDGRQDLIVSIGGTRYVQLSTGQGFSSATATGLPSCVGEFLDANGDGLTDYVCVNGSSLNTYLRNGSAIVPDLAVAFTDGFGVTQSVSYAISTLDGYSPGTGATYPLVNVTAPMVLARIVTATDGIGGNYTTTYNYLDGEEDIQGRGFSGFDTVKIVDSRDGGMQRYRRFRQGFPYRGMLSQESLYQADSTTVSVQNFNYYHRILTSNRYFPYIDSISRDVHEVGGARNGHKITHVGTSNTFDDYGNLTASTTTVTDEDVISPLYLESWTTATTATFTPSTTYWCFGLPTSLSVASSTTVSGEPSVTRSKSYTPDYVNCRMDAESTEPSSSTLRVDTSYEYDGLGNVKTVSVTGRNPNASSMTARVTRVGWGTTGQFPVSHTNALSQTTTRTFHSTFGSLLTETDPNGILVVSNTYEAFGRLQTETQADGTYAIYDYELLGPGFNPAAIDQVVKTSRGSDTSFIRYEHVFRDRLGRMVNTYQLAPGGGYWTGARTYTNSGRVATEAVPFWTTGGYQYVAPYSTSYTYDLLGRVTQQSRPRSDSDATAVTTTYSYAGRTQSVTDPNSKVSTKIVDVNGWMRRSRDHDSYGQNFSYDAAGSLTAVTDTGSNALFSAIYDYGARPFQRSTTDMDLGTWNYVYNSLGELLYWQDPISYASNPYYYPFSQTYDALSRVVSRTEAEGTTYWTWGTGGYGIGKLAYVSMPGYAESYGYDSSGRLSQRNIDPGVTSTYDYTYNAQGLLDTLTYPTSTSGGRVAVKYCYAYGVLQQVRDGTSCSSGTAYWTANTQNARGQTTQETLGNGVVTSRTVDAVTGWLKSIQSGPSGGSASQNHSYFYDKVGNVAQRQTYIGITPLTEDFYLDNLYRLDYSQLNGVTNLDLTYDALGNITARSDVNGGAAWSYHGTKKHAVAGTGSGGTTYSYDANGNMTGRGGATISWTSYNYLSNISTGTESAAFYYGPDRQYYRQDYAGPSGTETTYYIGGLLEKVCPAASCSSGTTDWRHYISANGKTVAIVSRKSGSADSVSYPLEDNQGSLSVITNSSGGDVVRASYEAFGGQRDGDDWSGPEASGDLTTMEAISRRGYTSHSMLGRMGLIHMNGRVQDPTIGRFLSPDPFVFEPQLTQGFNRYAYVNNNPQSYVDPSGFARMECNWGYNPFSVTAQVLALDGSAIQFAQGAQGGSSFGYVFGQACSVVAETDLGPTYSTRVGYNTDGGGSAEAPQTEIPCKAGTQCSLAPRCLGPLSADMQNEYRNAKRTAFANFFANSGNKEESFSIFRNDSTGRLRTLFNTGGDSGVNPYVSLSGSTTEIIGHIHNRPGVKMGWLYVPFVKEFVGLEGASPKDEKFADRYPNVDFVVYDHPPFGDWRANCF